MLIYIAGPYAENIAVARAAAIAVWELGHIAICPHLNTAHFEEDSGLGDEVYLAGDLEILRRCDAILMLPGSDCSEGATSEMHFAVDRAIPVYRNLADLPAKHPTEERCPEQCGAFIDAVMEMYRVHLDKNADYSPANILGMGEVGVGVRLWDKTARLLNLLGFDIHAELKGQKPPREPKNEAIADTYLDLACYGIIGKLVRDRVWGR
mgnify:CR=1 FL=1